MKFAEDHNEARYKITGYEAHGVKINHKLFTHSLVISPMELLENWEPKSFDLLQEKHLDAYYDFKPEIILLGTGEKQMFPEPEILRRFVQEGIGYEVMTTQAACRTFNILMSEGRTVVAGLFFE